MKAVTILGATGSIGTSALDVIARHPERYRVHALTAQSNVDGLADLALRFGPDVVVIGDVSLEGRLRDALRERGATARVAGGRDALVDVARGAGGRRGAGRDRRRRRTRAGAGGGRGRQAR